MCKVIECHVKDQTVAEELRQFEDWVCKILFIANEQIPLRESTNKTMLAKQYAATSKYCIDASLSILMRTANLNDEIFTGKVEITDTSAASEETKE